jgi:hypothetical protein
MNVNSLKNINLEEFTETCINGENKKFVDFASNYFGIEKSYVIKCIFEHIEYLFALDKTMTMERLVENSKNSTIVKLHNINIINNFNDEFEKSR